MPRKTLFQYKGINQSFESFFVLKGFHQIVFVFFFGKWLLCSIDWIFHLVWIKVLLSIQIDLEAYLLLLCKFGKYITEILSALLHRIEGVLYPSFNYTIFWAKDFILLNIIHDYFIKITRSLKRLLYVLIWDFKGNCLRWFLRSFSACNEQFIYKIYLFRFLDDFEILLDCYVLGFL